MCPFVSVAIKERLGVMFVCSYQSLVNIYIHRPKTCSINQPNTSQLHNEHKMVYKSRHLTLFGLCLVVIVVVIALHFKNKWVPAFRAWLSRRRIRLDGYAGVSSFVEDIESGLTSEQFNLREHNANDSRQGLNEEAKKKILQLMEHENLTFDEARLRFTETVFQKHNVGSDGLPLDPKAVFFGK